MINNDNDTTRKHSSERKPGSDSGINESESGVGMDRDAGNMEHGIIGGAGLPDNLDSSTDSSSGAGNRATGNAEETGTAGNPGEKDEGGTTNANK